VRLEWKICLGATRNKRTTVVRNQAIKLDTAADEIFVFEVSDEGLEAAAGEAKDKANYTLGACTGLSVCPG